MNENLCEQDTLGEEQGAMASSTACADCDSEDTVVENDGFRCLDCGSTFERAPTGELVRSKRLWWIERIGYSFLLVALPVNIVWSYHTGETLAMQIGLVALPILLVLDGPKVLEAVRVLRREMQ